MSTKLAAVVIAQLLALAGCGGTGSQADGTATDTGTSTGTGTSTATGTTTELSPTSEPTAARLDLAWLHRRGDPQTDVALLVDAVRGLDAWRGRVQAFVHGEAGEVRAIRRLLLGEGKVDRSDLSCSPYWRRHLTDEEWRRIKAEWNAEVERDVA